jgi:hypothetical protein
MTITQLSRKKILSQVLAQDKFSFINLFLLFYDCFKNIINRIMAAGLCRKIACDLS